MAIYTPTPEELGRSRFPDNKAFRKTLSTTASDILSQMQDLLASNYPFVLGADYLRASSFRFMQHGQDHSFVCSDLYDNSRSPVGAIIDRLAYL
jgi:hypothetical protein